MRILTAALLCLLITQNCFAQLFDRGNGMLYDNVLNITWLKDANYAKTSGAHDTGLMTWQEAKDWVANLEYAGFKDWRLPKTHPVNQQEYQLQFSFDGSTDIAYNIVSPQSELAYQYYVNLNNSGMYDSYGRYTGCASNPETYCLGNTGPFQNLVPGGYWSGTQIPGYSTPFGLNTYVGFQAESTGIGFAWAVRDGDVAGGCR